MPNVLLHGACKAAHVLVDGSRLALVDLDRIGMGHPAYDVGRFLSSLWLEALPNSPPAYRTSAYRFLEGYAARAPWRLSPVSVLWYMAAQLIEKGTRKYVLRFREGRQEEVVRIVTLAEKAMAGCEELRGEQSLEAIWKVLP